MPLHEECTWLGVTWPHHEIFGLHRSRSGQVKQVAYIYRSSKIFEWQIFIILSNIAIAIIHVSECDFVGVIFCVNVLIIIGQHMWSTINSTLYPVAVIRSGEWKHVHCSIYTVCVVTCLFNLVFIELAVHVYIHNSPIIIIYMCLRNFQWA